MHLKKLELAGFKSFADRTVVLFDNGVTCVVGPNGCGKSNISDSIRWVLGERSAKILRGSKMEDVIFAGTQFRKPVAFAEVSLTIDNKDRGLPIDYNEVTITRRLHRTGESEYLINKTACRLKDVQDLILDTGIGSNSYSMIEQGRIDYILNAGAEERRFLIEEAAGISKYKVKKEEALRKLERTEQNLLRIRDIVAEVQRNIQYAERQAKKAQKYQEQYEKLKTLEIKRAFYDIARIDLENDQLQKSRVIFSEQMETLTGQISGLRERGESLAASLKDVLAAFSAEEARRYEIKGNIEQHEQHLRFNQEKRLEFATRKGEIQQEKTQVDERLVRSEAEIEVKQTEVESIEGLRFDAAEAFRRAEETLKQIEDHLSAAKSLFEETKNGAAQINGEAARIRNDYHRLCAFLETSMEQRRKQEAGVNRYQDELDQWSARKEDVERNLQTVLEKIQFLGEEKARYAERVNSLTERIKEAYQKAEAAERSIHERVTRMRLLEEMDAAAGLSLEHVLDGLSDEEKTLIRRLRDLVHVQEGYEWVLEAALGDFARGLVTENPDVAGKLLNDLIHKKSAPTGILVRRALEATAAVSEDKPGHPDISTALSNVIRVEEAYAGLFDPFFSHTFVLERLDSENFQAILELSRKYRLITREGTVLGPQGQIYFRQGQISSEHSLFKRGAEIETLRVEIQELNRGLEEWRSSAQTLSSELGSAEATLEGLETEHLEAKIQKESYESMKSGVQDRLGTYQRELELIFHERQESQLREEEAISQKTQLEIELVKIEERQRRIRAEQENIIRDMEAMEQGKSAATKEFAEHKARLDNLLERKRYLEEALKLLREHEKRDRERLGTLTEETARIFEREKALDAEDDTLRAELELLSESKSASERALERIREERTSLENNITSVEASLRNAQEEKHAVEESIHEQEKKLMDLGYARKNIVERLNQSYKIDLLSLNAAEYPLSEEERPSAEEEIETMSRRVESLGTVNLLAIEEFDELKQRFDFLMNQQKDLEDSRMELLEAIRKINRTTKGLFESTFQEVQKAFKEYYEILFRGGEAKLILIDETNPLESGVDIVVRPPGKKLQHISLMSGGEKAMTALALLFALFKIKPSPFCVLDEVDAPLDEANVDRFLTVLRTFLKTTQFIIVTHNRKTIGMGDSLYGVTMQEAGVSKIVSVKVARDTDEAFEIVESEEPAAEETQPQGVNEESVPS